MLDGILLERRGIPTSASIRASRSTNAYPKRSASTFLTDDFPVAMNPVRMMLRLARFIVLTLVTGVLTSGDERTAAPATSQGIFPSAEGQRSTGRPLGCIAHRWGAERKARFDDVTENGVFVVVLF